MSEQSFRTRPILLTKNYTLSFHGKHSQEEIPMRRFTTSRNIVLSLVLLLAVSSPAFAALTTQTGTLPDGATYLIEVPSPWNGTLLLYSHGYVTPGSPNPARDVGDPGTRAFMLANGFALAGSSYAHTGWAIQRSEEHTSELQSPVHL